MIITANISFQGIDAPVTITSQVGVQQGQPTITVQSMQFGSLPVPSVFQDQIASQIQSSLAQVWAGVPIEVQDIQIQEGVMTITGIAKPQ